MQFDPHTRCGNAASGLLLLAMVGAGAADRGSAEPILLPEPRYRSQVSVEEALRARRSARNYSPDSLTLADISQLLWSAQGVSDGRDRRLRPVRSIHSSCTWWRASRATGDRTQTLSPDDER